MPGDYVQPLILLAGTVVAIAYARAWMARTADLKLSLFRPYRGDPWPIGVQEDDDFHFNWAAAAAPGSAMGTDGGGNDFGDAALDSVADETNVGWFEEIRGGSVAAERVGRISIRRIGR
jgi:hypothetical protein